MLCRSVSHLYSNFLFIHTDIAYGSLSFQFPYSSALLLLMWWEWHAAALGICSCDEWHCDSRSNKKEARACWTKVRCWVPVHCAAPSPGAFHECEEKVGCVAIFTEGTLEQRWYKRSLWHARVAQGWRLNVDADDEVEMERSDREKGAKNNEDGRTWQCRYSLLLHTVQRNNLRELGLHMVLRSPNIGVWIQRYFGQVRWKYSQRTEARCGQGYRERMSSWRWTQGCCMTQFGIGAFLRATRGNSSSACIWAVRRCALGRPQRFTISKCALISEP